MKLLLSFIMIIFLSLTMFAYGTIIVSSNIDGASVYVNGNFQGKTPLTLIDFPSKDYNIKVENNGYSNYEKSFSLTQNATVNLYAKLKKIKPIYVSQDVYFKINSDPIGSKVYINGKYAGRTPLYINEKKVIGKEVYIYKKGYQGYYQTFTSSYSNNSCNISLNPVHSETYTVSTTYTNDPKYINSSDYNTKNNYNKKKYNEPRKERRSMRNILIGAELLNEVITPHEKHKKQNRGAILGGIFLNEILNNK